jgi:hypothetical protein
VLDPSVSKRLKRIVFDVTNVGGSPLAVVEQYIENQKRGER